MVGTALVWLALAASLVSAGAYLMTAFKKRHIIKIARNAYAVSTASIFASSVLLLLYIVRHQFEYSYVWDYSSRDLSQLLLVTTFWAGQEGSFLLWAIFSAVIGLFLTSYTRKKHIEYEVMGIYAILQSFLIMLIVVKSPFRMIWDAFPGEVAVGTIPTDGKGLNPLLQNMWMAIHPPVLFLGFAAMAVPFAFALAALWRKMYRDWTTHALPWVLFGVFSLGTGIMLGGYWAYGVLGWGGWWGWDPVENSSLIPWIVGLVLVHTLLIQKKTGALVRTNLILGILTYALVVYSTFLTRSGILGSASVHSFVDPGTIVYALLVVWVVSVLIVGGLLMLRRWKGITTAPMDSGVFRRETALSITAAVLGVSAVVIFFGTNWPIIANASLEPSFYNKTNLPLGIAMAFLLGFSLLVRWQEDSRKDLLRKSAIGLGGSLLGTGVLVALGIYDIEALAFSFVSFLAFIVNVETLLRLALENVRLVGGPLAHVGTALLFFGIIGSGFYSEKKTVSLSQNQPKDVFGYNVTYVKSEPTSDGKTKYVVKAERDGDQFEIEPVMFQSSYNEQLMRNPDYVSFLTRDFYIEPVSLERSQPEVRPEENLLEIEKGKSAKFEDFNVRFIRFDMGQHGSETMASGDATPLGVVLEVTRGKQKKQLTPVTLFRQQGTPEFRAAMFDDNIGIQLISMNVDMETKRSKVLLNIIGIHGPTVSPNLPVEMLVVEASLKPLISLVWIGSFLMVVGVLIAMARRRNAQATVAAPTDGVK